MFYYLTILGILFSCNLLFFYLFYKNNTFNYEIRELIYLFFIGGLYELICTIILRFDSQIWFKIYSFFEFIALTIFFKKLIGISNTKFYFILISYSILFIALGIPYLNQNTINLLELYISISTCILVFSCYTKWTIQQFEKLENSSLFHFPIFYVLSGMILYYSGTFFIFGLETIFRYTKSSILLYFWYINLVLLFVYRLSFYIAIWKAKKF